MSVDISLALGIGVALLALAVAGFTAYRYRGVPMTREEMLEKRIEDLEATVRILQERIRELEEDVEHYKAIANGQAPARRRASRPRTKRLSGEQMRELREMLLDAHDTQETWEQLLLDTDHRIDIVSLGPDLESVASTVLARANAEGWIGALITAAAAQRPLRKDLATLIAELHKALGA